MAFSSISFARGPILDAWEEVYPDSNSSALGCQLCHLNENGGEPWNAYGWSIRQAYIAADRASISNAFRDVEDNNADADPKQANSVDEIANDYQPGWTSGSNNIVYDRVGGTTTGITPPAMPSTTGVDFPASVEDPISNVARGSIAIQLDEIATGFNAPLRAVRAPGLDDSLFVIEQTGKIIKVELESGTKSEFFDVSLDLVAMSSGFDERGLLGLAFHPNYSNNGLFYTYQSEPVRASQDSLVDYSTTTSPNHRSIVVEYQVSNPSTNSNISKVENLLIIDQPQSNHNGGDLVFGPDGMLYISIGDGGSAHDEGAGHGARGNGRDNTNPLGAILRIDVNGSNSANGKYGIPTDNPFTDLSDPGVDEIYAYGFRNPFRFSFDAESGELYVGDVGQSDVEEINKVILGGNYGWNWKEGRFYFYNSNSTGNYVSQIAPPGVANNLLDPMAEYDHDDGISVTGGYVYRGSELPVLEGRYVFADWNQRLFYLNDSNNVVEFIGQPVTDYVTGFGQDANNELYIVTNNTLNPSGTEGKLLKLTEGSVEPDTELCMPIKASNGNVAVICL